MRYNTEVPPKVTIEDDGMKQTRTSHPSYGMISVSRRTGSNKELHGTDIEHDTFMSITISNSDLCQSLGRNWYFEQSTITEVEMSAVQYAEMISSPNTRGVPCTIKRTQDLGSIKYEPPMPIVDSIEEDIKEFFSDTRQANSEVMGKVESILEQKTIKKSDKEAILNLIKGLSRKLLDHIPFYEKSVGERLDRTKMEAKAEVDAYITHAITEVGKQAISSPDILSILAQSSLSNKDINEKA